MTAPREQLCGKMGEDLTFTRELAAMAISKSSIIKVVIRQQADILVVNQ
jgi:hypothetical protein